LIDFVGDICLANGSEASVSMLQERPLFPVLRSDLVVGNLECVFVDESEFDSNSFNFCCMKDRVNILSNLGVNCVSLANNHVMDGGRQGLVTTMDVLESKEIKFFGAGLNSKIACSPLNLKIDGKEYAFLGRLEVESFEGLGDAIAGDSSPGVAALDIEELRSCVSDLKIKGVDYVVLCIHWGVQEVHRVHTRIQEKAQILIQDVGVDLIIGNHSHCIQGATKISNKDVFFGLGNYFFLPYRFKGETLYDGTDRLNSESLMIRVSEKKGLLESNSHVVCQGTDSKLELVKNSRQSYIKNQVYGPWASKIAALYHMEYRIRGLLIEFKKVKLLLTSKEQRGKLYYELFRPHIFLKRVIDIIFNPRHR
jgi:hypothetical protein